MQNTIKVLIAVFFAIMLTASITKAETINGAGSTFVYPILSKWAYKYNKETGVKINYQSIGSGGGVKQIIANTVDFGASDAPLKPEKLKKESLYQFPMIIGGVVPIINLKGFGAGDLNLSREAIAGIFLGTIDKWNDPIIAAANLGTKLPSKKITVVHRADGSGTSWIFTNYLDKISTEWHDRVGFGKAVEWPTGVGGKGNEGVASYVKRIKGSIGYVEYAYVVQNKMSYAALENHDGTSYVKPTAEAFQTAAANARWSEAPGYYLVLTDQPGAGSWPISGAAFILMHLKQDAPQTAKQALKFFDWCYNNGQAMAADLHYVPMPANVIKMIENDWKTVFTPSIWQ